MRCVTPLLSFDDRASYTTAGGSRRGDLAKVIVAYSPVHQENALRRDGTSRISFD
jgi:hypothetical protein